MVHLTLPRRPLLRACAAVLLLALAASAAARVALWLGVPAPERLAVDEENGTFAYLHAALLALVAALWAVAAGREASRARRRAWAVLAVASLWVSFDEMAAIHEELIEPLRAALGGGGLVWFAWVVPGAVAVAALAAFVARPVLALPRAVRRLLVAGAALYVAGGLGMEVIGGAEAAAHGETTLRYVVLVHVEEALESAGLLTLLAGLTAWLAAPPAPAGRPRFSRAVVDVLRPSAREAVEQRDVVRA